MPKKFSTNYFVYLYKHKHLAPRTISKSIFLTYNKIHAQDICTKFIFYIFFSDTNDKIECPAVLKKLLQYDKLIHAIKRDLFTKNIVDIKKLPTYFRVQNLVKIQATQEEIYEMMSLLLTLEINMHNMYLSDISLVFTLVKNLDNQNIIRILNKKYQISPLICILLNNIQDEIIVPEYYNDFYVFLKSLNSEYREGFEYLNHRSIIANTINYLKLEKSILYSKYKIINEYHRIFVNYYPEIIYNCKLSNNRLDYFKNPLNIPLEYSLLRTYLFCIPYYLKIINPKLNEPNFDILFRTIYVEKIFGMGLTKKWCKLLHILILDNCNLVYVLLRRKFDIEYVKMIVKNVPSFHLAFDQSIKFFRESGDDFYLKVIECLLIEYPVKEYFKKVSVQLEYFPNDFTKKFSKYFKAINEGI